MMVAMAHLDTQDPVAVATVEAIRSGDVGALRRLLDMYPDLTTVRLGDPCGMSRTLLHVATDWPGHFPNGPQMIEVLVEAGADVNGRFAGSHTETPLHWAASSDDVAALDALLDAGADIEATGAVIGGGTAISDACAFAQWNAARRLIERGAGTLLWEAAALGLMDRVRAHFAAAPAHPRGHHPWPVVGLPRRPARSHGVLPPARRRHRLGRPRPADPAGRHPPRRRRRPGRMAARSRRPVGRRARLTASAAPAAVA